MSGESTYNTISGLVNSIWETAFLTLSESTTVGALVRNFNDSESGTPRQWAQYTGGTIVSLAEISDLTAQAFTPASAGTITPAMYAMQYYLTDLRIASDWNNVQADAGQDLGRVFGVAVDTALVGDFASLTGGTVGSAGGTLTWANVMRAEAYLRANYASGELSAVVRPEHWYYLTSASSGVPELMKSPRLMDSVAGNYYVGSALGVNFYIDANITSGTAAKAAMFTADAMVLDTRRGFRIEPQRDASRGGGGYELNASLIYAHGIYRPTWGVQMIGTSA